MANQAAWNLGRNHASSGRGRENMNNAPAEIRNSYNAGYDRAKK